MRVKYLLLFLVVTIFSGCGSYIGTKKEFQSNYISPSLKDSIKYMYEEERLAHDVYLSIYKKQAARQLYQIATNSETRHIEAVKNLAYKYNINLPYRSFGRYTNSHIESLYNSLYKKGIRSLKDALEVGCIVEVTDINDLNEYISKAQREGANDIADVYQFLRRGSYNHYWAFDRGLKRIGVVNGCCSLGSKYCHLEYPSYNKGYSRNKRGNCRARGLRRGY